MLHLLFFIAGSRGPLRIIQSLPFHPSVWHFHSWKESARILLLGTVVHPIKFLLLIAHQLAWPILDRGHDLSFSRIGFQTLIPEWNQLGSCYLAHWSILSKTFVRITHQLLWLITYIQSVALVTDSHSWMGLVRILPIGTLMHHVNTLLVIAHQLP